MPSEIPNREPLTENERIADFPVEFPVKAEYFPFRVRREFVPDLLFWLRFYAR